MPSTAIEMQSTAIDSSKVRVSGFVAPGFEEVRAEFERNFEERGEIGAAVAAYWRDETRPIGATSPPRTGNALSHRRPQH
jgi:hypothetical protein